MRYRDAEVTKMLAETKAVIDVRRYSKFEADIREFQVLALQQGPEADLARQRLDLMLRLPHLDEAGLRVLAGLVHAERATSQGSSSPNRE